MIKLEEWTPETVPDAELEDRLAKNVFGALIDHIAVHTDESGKYVGLVLDNGVTIYLQECWLAFNESS
jgi:hypothetical protein